MIAQGVTNFPQISIQCDCDLCVVYGNMLIVLLDFHLELRTSLTQSGLLKFV